MTIRCFLFGHKWDLIKRVEVVPPLKKEWALQINSRFACINDNCLKSKTIISWEHKKLEDITHDQAKESAL